MKPQRLPPRVASPIRDPDSLVGLQRNLESTPQGKIQKLSDHHPPCGTSTVSLSADSVEQQEENNPFDTPEQQASVHHGTGMNVALLGIRQWPGGRRSIGYFLWIEKGDSATR